MADETDSMQDFGNNEERQLEQAFGEDVDVADEGANAVVGVTDEGEGVAEDAAAEAVADEPASPTQPATVDGPGSLPDVIEADAQIIEKDIEPAEDEAEPLTPEAVIGAAREAAQVGADAAREAAQAGAASVTQGMAAVRAVSAAKRAHASAREALAQIEQTAAELTDELDHRREVEQNFDGIIELQNKELAEANEALAQASASHSRLEAELEQAKADLAQLKASNEQKLAQPRELANDARAKLDEAEREARDARRAVKGAQAQADDAIGSRDSRIQAANRAAQTAQGRLDKLQAQLTEMRRDPSAGARNLTEKSSEVAGALAQLENAKAEIARINAEAAQGVEAAQTHLYTQRKSLEMIEDDLARAMDDEREKRTAFDELKSACDAAEKEAGKKVKGLAGDIEAARQDGELARGRIDAANAQIADARDIHAHPEATDQLAARVAEVNASLAAQRAQVAELANEERVVRERTQRTRYVFYGLIAAAILIVVLFVLVLV